MPSSIEHTTHLKNFAQKRPLKISGDGTYLPFAGLSVVCRMLPSDSWARLPDMLTAVAGHWISALPSSSYHATLLAGPCQAKLGLNVQAWEQFLSDRHSKWVKMEHILSTASFRPRSLRYLKLRDLNRWGICIDFHLEDSLEADLATKLRGVLRENGEGCFFEERERPWHITLAYRRPDSDRIPQNIADQIQKLVETCILENTWLLAPATLCYHPDMTSFVDLMSLSFWRASERETLMDEGVHAMEYKEEQQVTDSELRDEAQMKIGMRRGRWRRSHN